MINSDSFKSALQRNQLEFPPFYCTNLYRHKTSNHHHARDFHNSTSVWDLFLFLLDSLEHHAKTSDRIGAADPLIYGKALGLCFRWGDQIHSSKVLRFPATAE
ncbi:hypothetical protein GDO81_026827, partial [Engystomops pustulosus]